MSIGRRAYDILRGHVNQEWERLQGLDVFSAPAPAASPELEPTELAARPTPKVDPHLRATAVLGVSVGTPFNEIREAFLRLEKRSDPENFPENSPERARASEIQKEIRWAYGVLTENVDPTEKRFGSLEID